MPLTVSDELLQTAHLNEVELLLEIAVTLFQQDRLTLGQAAAFAGLTQLDMQRILASRRIPLHYGPEDLEHDLATVRSRLRA
jgi:predicted HTH domain antitoxin